MLAPLCFELLHLFIEYVQRLYAYTDSLSILRKRGTLACTVGGTIGGTVAWVALAFRLFHIGP